jgi:DNA-binding MltR family transcriptional regulator
MPGRRPPPRVPELSEDISRFVADLQQEKTDRGVALVGAAFLDDALRALIRAALIEKSETADNLFKYPGPLATFAARTDFAYCMGLIGKMMFQDLKLVREVRNSFAHQHRPARFEDPEVTRLCKRLRIGHLYELVSPDARNRFILEIVMLSIEILHIGHDVKHAKPGAEFRLPRVKPPL